MEAEKIRECVKQIVDHDLIESLGEHIIDMHEEDFESPNDIGSYVVSTFNSCKTDGELKIAAEMFLNLVGTTIFTAYDRIYDGEEE